MLQPLGVSSEAEAVYVALVPMEAADSDRLAARLGYGGDRLRTALDQLADLGLAVSTGPDEWRAVPPVTATQHLKQQRESEINAAVVAAESLYSNLLAAAAQHDGGDQITVLIGREAIVPAYSELVDGIKTSLCNFDKPPYVSDRPNATPETLRVTSPEWRAIERGVDSRSVYHPGFDLDRLTELKLFAERGEQSRAGSVPMKLILADKRTALIPSMASYAPGHDLRVSIVRHPLLVEALLWLFEAVWESSVPIMSAGQDQPDPRRQMLISLLMTGSTDGAIATQLGINVRSVRRWISELMDELGVTTRLQLGAALVRADNMRTGFGLG